MSILNTITKQFEVFADINTVDYNALKQFADAMNCEFVTRGALMPDVHLGYSLPIGSVVQTKKYIIPSWVGYDIGCGMCAVKTDFGYNDIMNNLSKIRDRIYNKIPVGFNKRSSLSRVYSDKIGVLLENTSDDMKKIYEEVNGDTHCGTLGGGNHFIELGINEDKEVWVVIHSGSRGVGHKCASHYMRKASPTNKATDGNFGFNTNSVDGMNYTKDMNFCLEFALLNRKMMIEIIIECINEFVDGSGIGEIINRNHNHAETKDGVHWTHRKGATHAEKGMMGIIPGNMKDGSFIVEGLGNDKSLCSSSHGAGRVMGRKQAKKSIDFKDFEESMVGIMAPVDKNHIDESSFAYKNIFDVMDLQKELIKVVDHEVPILVIKG